MWLYIPISSVHSGQNGQFYSLEPSFCKFYVTQLTELKQYKLRRETTC